MTAVVWDGFAVFGVACLAALLLGGLSVLIRRGLDR